MRNLEVPLVAFISFLFHSFFVVHTKDVVRARRATNMENVEAIYNRFTRTSKGKASYYGEYPMDGLCSLDPPPPLANQPDLIKIAVGKDDFQGSLGCGMCVEIQGSGIPSAPDLNGATPVNGVLKGMVYDLCGACKQGDVDLYVPGNGVWDITMKAIDCPSLKGSVGYIQFKFTGSNEYYFKVQTRNAKIPVAGMEVFNTVTNDWYCLKKTDDNFFTSEGLGKVTFPMKVRLTSITNEKLETTITTLKNDESFPSDVQFSGMKKRGGSPTGIECYGQGHKSTKDQGPEVDEKFCAGKEDGIYADPNDCSTFYECANGKSYKQYCENGLKFNALTGKCDAAEKVNCALTEKYVSTTKRFSEEIETEGIELEDISPRSTEEVFGEKGIPEKRSDVPIRRISRPKRHHHHHHHHHLHTRSKFHRRHKKHILHNNRLHLKSERTKVHQGAKRTADKGVNLKVKVQFKGPNLSGTLVSNDPMNPNEGDITLSAVQNAEQGDSAYVVPANSVYHGHDSEEQTIPSNKDRQENYVNPFDFGDDSQYFQAREPVNEEGRPMGGAFVVQASQMQDGTLQTSTRVRPKEVAESTKETVSDSSKEEKQSHPMNIESLLRNSFQAKPQVVSVKEDGSGDNANDKTIQITKMQQQNLPAVEKNSTLEEKRRASKAESKAIQGIMETINMLKTITKGNSTKINNNFDNKKGDGPAASVLHSEKSKEATNTKEVSKSDGNVTSSQKSSKSVNDSKQPQPQQPKQKANSGILFVISRAKNSSKQDKEKSNDHKVVIMPDIGTKLPRLDNNKEPKSNASMEQSGQKPNVTLQFSMSSKQESEPGASSEKQSQFPGHSSANSKNLKKNKDTNSTTTPEPNSLSGLIGLIGNLVQNKLKNTFNQTRNGSKVSVNANNATRALEDVDKNITIGKINISLQSVEQSGHEEKLTGSVQEKPPLYHPTVAMKPLITTIDLNKPFQIVRVPIRSDPGVSDQTFANGSVDAKLSAMKERPSNASDKENSSKHQEQTNADTQLVVSRNGSQDSKSGDKPIPIMRIRLKGPSNKLGVVSISQDHSDEIFSKKGKQNSIFIDSLRNADNEEAAQKVKPLHTTTVIIRQYHKDVKPVNYGSEDIFDTLPMKGSDNFDTDGNMKLPSPVISMNDAEDLLQGDRTLLDNSAMRNALYNPDSNSFSERKEDSMKSSQQNTITENEIGPEGGADDFAQALQRQEDQPKTPSKMASKENEQLDQAATSFPDEKAQAFHSHRFKGIEKVPFSKPHAPVMSGYMNGYGSPPMGMHNGNNMNVGMNDVPMGMNVGQGIQMSGGMQGMASKPGAGMVPVEMQPISGNEEDVDKNMKQALSSMQDMAMKQIQSKYPGMPITMKTEDSEESEEEQQQTGSGDSQEEAGNASMHQEVFGKHKEDGINKEKGEESNQNNEGKTEKPSASDSTPKPEKPNASNSTPKPEMPSASDSTPKPEKPSASDSTPKPDKPSVSDSTPKPEEPSASDSSAKQEEKKEDNQKSTGTISNESNKQNQGNTPVKESGPIKQQDTSSVAVKKLDPKELCRIKASGVYSNDEDPSKFIICYKGVTEERQCSDGMVFNPREKVCEPSDSTLANKMQDESKAKNKSKGKSKSIKGKAKDSAKGKKSSKTKKQS